MVNHGFLGVRQLDGETAALIDLNIGVWDFLIALSWGLRPHLGTRIPNFVI
jgi:hypothetical protein